MSEFPNRWGLKRKGLPDKVNFPVCLAPMVGLSHLGLRAVVRDYLPAGAVTIWPSEMLNSRRLPSEEQSRTPEAMTLANESVWVPQILGNEEKFIAPSVEKLHSWGAEAIDINMGCPVRKALRHNYGVALMGDADYAAEVVRVTVKHSRNPVSVKLRAGSENNSADHLIQFMKKIEDAGASWVTFHPRTSEQKRRGRADWEQICKVRESLGVPVIGNGDVQTADDVIAMFEKTDADMVMVGRALTARPWMLWQLGERWGWPAPEGHDGKRAPSTPEEEGAEYGRCLKRILQHMIEAFPEKFALRKFQFLVRTSCVWLYYGQSLYQKVTQAKTAAETFRVMEEFFSVPQAMSAKTDLRI